MAVILVTGAGSGIGYAICTRLWKDGHDVIMTSNHSGELSTAYEYLKNFPVGHLKKLHAFLMDVTNAKQIETVVGELNKKSLFVDVLINNAGLALGGKEHLQDISIEDITKMVSVNVMGTLYVTRLLLPMLLKSPHGRLINMGSITAIQTYPGGAVYSATKSAIRTVSDALRMELVDKPITVTTIQPGLTKTNFHFNRFGQEKSVNETYRGIEPLSAEDVADAVSYVINAPANVQIGEITLTPLHQASVSHTHRKRYLET